MRIVRRKSVRALLLTPAREILLIRIANPESSWAGWITPGGGREENEDEAAALGRELFEELGLTNAKLGPRLWRRSHRFPWKGELIEQEEVFYLVPTERFTAKPHLNPDAAELSDFQEIRWWTFAELEKSQELFAPRRLAFLIGELFTRGAPNKPLEIGT